MPSAFWRFSLLALASVAVLAHAEGDLDYGFQYGGRLYVPVAYAAPYQSTCVDDDVAAQADGKILIAGSCALSFLSGATQVNYPALGTVMRLNADGTLDTTFGNRPWPSAAAYPSIPGFQFFAQEPGTNAGNAIAVRADGHIVVAGTLAGRNFQPATPATPLSIAIAQLTSDGSFDTGFGTNGISIVFAGNFDSGDNRLGRIVLDGQGNVVIAGSYAQGNTQTFLYGRLTADGTSAQLFEPAFNLGGTEDDYASDMAIDAQGRYVIVGSAQSNTSSVDCAVIRVNPSTLQLDTTFGTQGIQIVAFNAGGTRDNCTSVAIQPADGKILIAGNAGNASGMTDAVATRLTANGALDASFGKLDLSTSVSGALASISRVLVQPWDGKIILVGGANSTQFVLGEDFAAIRLNTAGGLDTSFAAATPDSLRGVVQVDFGFNSASGYTNETANSAAFSGHSLVMAGTQSSSVAPGYAPTPQFAVTRLSYDDIFRFGFDPLPTTPVCRNGSATPQAAMTQLVQATDGLQLCIPPISQNLGNGITGTACASSICAGTAGCMATVHTQAGGVSIASNLQSLNVFAVPAQIDPVSIPATLSIPYVGSISCTITASGTTFDIGGVLGLASDHQFGGYIDSANVAVTAFATQLSGCSPYTSLIQALIPTIETALLPELNSQLNSVIPAAVQEDICLQ